MTLSVIIPSYRDPLLRKTIDSLLENSELGDKLEIIASLDGYWPPAEDIVSDSRVKYLHLGRNRGMRGAINAGVSISSGEYLMRADEHCMFARGFDKAMTDVCEPNWIMTARRYYLDPVKWEVMDIPYVDYERLVIQDMGNGIRKFAGQKWSSRSEERKEIMIDETMAMQGSVWCMSHDWWNKVIVELDTENYGPLIQDSHEMQFKTWQAGGKLMLNKNVWFAHKHRSFSRTHNNGTLENPANCEAGYKYALDTWGKYYEEVIRSRFKI